MPDHNESPANVAQNDKLLNDKPQAHAVARVAIIGGGLAGCECALALVKAGIGVRLFEMRPHKMSPAHETGKLAELVCSNSLRSEELTTAIGVLKAEMRELDSLVMKVADETRIPAGKALAVDRKLFADYITAIVEHDPKIEVVREEIDSLDSPLLDGFEAIVVAAGPLVSDSLAASLADLTVDMTGGEGGGKRLYFYDAIAPIISRESVDMDICFWGSRYRPEEDDYLNCPMTEEQYDTFLDALIKAEKVAPHEFEKHIHFEGCLPVEEMAERGRLTLAFGPLKPVGLPNPRTSEEAFAVVQLRAENKEKTAFNLVGFQTKLKYPEQERVFRLIPGLEKAEFLRLGSIHRNTFVDAPQVLNEELALKLRPNVHLAGQITGVEGYLESAACGLWVGLMLGRKLNGETLPPPPTTTALGALLGHLRTPPPKNFQPSNAHFGLTPELNRRAGKKIRKELYGQRARDAFAEWKKDCIGGE
ncbi:MAG: methylenetetrahydrofolate--tRNA-(uracil(54)-C(5))-methyltransferase (FADH(2)-oxidizing) TrmFO [Humidesulfovibrio sp.]|uniref:methylenetetrahydrofolate--tRNA-(uracil(54)- C(5))-methyltransferase (FADH(2)-oxidizing) TrmFO n=1 Tax=Humidesulfovibrio sp. TaxID=2910988 RepID=UPI0027F6003D|nr:methylenetetrahydrofolate--tRNA-(uracil(54)-C(5))-methyltransferase (FADH(2)-oxidizing) TrmFO [Humidesulfovibrio sp.]MDQ7833757.1 methylenetetrahydrofolate--tRNA-(uracil(54)-C(5))-methyltransferase (FADH(2)-oxidizing) TrmFO [Humidesulfovibrio sp.]